MDYPQNRGNKLLRYAGTHIQLYTPLPHKTQTVEQNLKPTCSTTLYCQYETAAHTTSTVPIRPFFHPLRTFCHVKSEGDLWQSLARCLKIRKQFVQTGTVVVLNIVVTNTAAAAAAATTTTTTTTTSTIIIVCEKMPKYSSVQKVAGTSNVSTIPYFYTSVSKKKSFLG